MNGGVLLLPQHYQRNDDDSCYNNTADHKSNDGTFIGANVLSEKHLPSETKLSRRLKAQTGAVTR